MADCNPSPLKRLKHDDDVKTFNAVSEPDSLANDAGATADEDTNVNEDAVGDGVIAAVAANVIGSNVAADVVGSDVDVDGDADAVGGDDANKRAASIIAGTDAEFMSVLSTCAQQFQRVGGFEVILRETYEDRTMFRMMQSMQELFAEMVGNSQEIKTMECNGVATGDVLKLVSSWIDSDHKVYREMKPDILLQAISRFVLWELFLSAVTDAVKKRINDDEEEEGVGDDDLPPGFLGELESALEGTLKAKDVGRMNLSEFAEYLEQMEEPDFAGKWF